VGQFDFSYAHITQSVEGSLKRLQTEYLDVLLLHRPDPLVEPEEVARAFDDLRSSGKVRYFGVSNHTAGQMKLLKKHLNQPLAANQLELSLLHLHLFDEGVVFNQEAMHGEGTLEYCNIAHDQRGGRKEWRGDYGCDEPPSQAAQEVAKVMPAGAGKGRVQRLPRLAAEASGQDASDHWYDKAGRIKAACEADDAELTRDEWYRLFIAGRGNWMP
jgi:predicted oxidoreductase